MDRFDQAVTAAEQKLRDDWTKGSADLLYAMQCERAGIDPTLPLFSRMIRNV